MFPTAPALPGYAPLVRALVLAAFALAPLTVTQSSNADDVTYVDCPWAPYKEAWACALPANFEQGRFNAPPGPWPKSCNPELAGQLRCSNPRAVHAPATSRRELAVTGHDNCH